MMKCPRCTYEAPVKEFTDFFRDCYMQLCPNCNKYLFPHQLPKDDEINAWNEERIGYMQKFINKKESLYDKCIGYSLNSYLEIYKRLFKFRSDNFQEIIRNLYCDNIEDLKNLLKMHNLSLDTISHGKELILNFYKDNPCLILNYCIKGDSLDSALVKDMKKEFGITDFLKKESKNVLAQLTPFIYYDGFNFCTKEKKKLIFFDMNMSELKINSSRIYTYTYFRRTFNKTLFNKFFEPHHLREFEGNYLASETLIDIIKEYKQFDNSKEVDYKKFKQFMRWDNIENKIKSLNSTLKDMYRFPYQSLLRIFEHTPKGKPKRGVSKKDLRTLHFQSFLRDYNYRSYMENNIYEIKKNIYTN